MFFLAKITCLVESENGIFLRKKEDFIVEDECYVGVESAIYAYFELEKIRKVQSYEINSIKNLKIDYPICNNNYCENWYKVTLASLVTNERADKEKVVLTHLLVNSENFENTVTIVKAYTFNWLAPTNIQSIALSNVKEFIPIKQSKILTSDEAKQARKV